MLIDLGLLYLILGIGLAFRHDELTGLNGDTAWAVVTAPVRTIKGWFKA